MITTIDTKKIITLEIERSEIYNILKGNRISGHVQVRYKNDDTPVEIEIYCSNPEDCDKIDSTQDV